MNHTTVVCTGIVTIGLLGFAAILIAGPLNPPAGAVAPTYKTLAEVEPRMAINAANTPGDANSLFKITQPGSYYLTGNITGEVGKHGIEIVASGVTIDFNGFDLVGVPGMGAFDGVSVTVSSLTNIEVRNGTVRGWGDEGVDLGSVVALNCIIEGVRSHANAGSGITSGNSSRISGCTTYQNGGFGIAAGISSTISGCTAYQNTSSGIFVGNGCTISGCTTYSNMVNGIVSSSGSVISGCTTSANIGIGIVAGSGSTISGCTARFNGVDGINVSSQCLILSNACDGNGNSGDGAGIHATGSDNRIEGNNCTLGDRGIDVDTGGNIIIRNTCSGNVTNWAIAINNVCFVVQSVTGGPIFGNTGGSASGSTDPNANFTY